MSCPFCGVVTDVAHETQEGCINALQREIARVKQILEHSTPLGAEVAPRRPSEDERKTSDG